MLFTFFQTNKSYCNVTSISENYTNTLPCTQRNNEAVSYTHLDVYKRQVWELGGVGCLYESRSKTSKVMWPALRLSRSILTRDVIPDNLSTDLVDVKTGKLTQGWFYCAPRNRTRDL